MTAKIPCLDFIAALLIKLFFSLFFPQTSIYAKGNNIEITQEELEEYTERYTVTGYDTARMQKKWRIMIWSKEKHYIKKL